MCYRAAPAVVEILYSVRAVAGRRVRRGADLRTPDKPKRSKIRLVQQAGPAPRRVKLAFCSHLHALQKSDATVTIRSCNT